MTIKKGPLDGVRALEFAGIGPGPFAGTFLSDLGADVLRIERPGALDPAITQFDARGRETVVLDLKTQSGHAAALDLAAKADVLFEGNRPGVMERLGLGPDDLLPQNPALVYGRMTGWGQTGPYAHLAGHDLNYLALTGALHAIGSSERPVPPLNLVADYGGGAMFLIAGLLAALLHARATGEGQVVDVAMTDCTAYLTSIAYSMMADGSWTDRRGANLLDGGAPFYDAYQCADGQWISIAAIEPQFYARLIEQTGCQELRGDQMDRTAWPRRKAALQAIFAKRTRAEWCSVMENADLCFAPILSLSEAPVHPHNVARGTFIDIGGATLPAPAPRFSVTPASVRWPPQPINRAISNAVATWGERELFV